MKKVRIFNFIVITNLVIASFTLPAYAQEKKEVFYSKIELLSNEVFVDQPIKMAFEWKNISDKTQTLFIDSGGFFVYIAFNADEFKQYKLFYPAEEELLEHISPEWSVYAALKPQEAYKKIKWALLGLSAGSKSWEFLFDKSGKYRVSLNADGKDTAVIIVKDVTSREDRDAQKLFSSEAAELFLGDIFKAKEAEPKLSTIVAKYPGSLYSPYAAFALANYQWIKEGGFNLNFPDFLKYLNFVTDRHSYNRQIYEDALYLMVKGLAFKKDGKHEAIKYFSNMQKEFPDSPYIYELQYNYGIGIEVPVKKEVLKIPKRRCEEFKFQGLEKISLEEARLAFKVYLESLAKEDLNRAINALADDFIGDDGNKNTRLRRLQDIDTGTNMLKLEVIVESSNRAGEYRRPFTLPMGVSRNWSGELIIVKGKLNFWLEDRRTGSQSVENDIEGEWALRREQIGIIKGKWALISEILSSRNSKVAYLEK